MSNKALNQVILRNTITGEFWNGRDGWNADLINAGIETPERVAFLRATWSFECVEEIDASRREIAPEFFIKARVEGQEGGTRLCLRARGGARFKAGACNLWKKRESAEKWLAFAREVAKSELGGELVTKSGKPVIVEVVDNSDAWLD